MALAVHWASKYRNRGVDIEDLVQVAYVGLIKAADGFDEDNGTKFSTYASYVIVRHIWSHINKENKVKSIKIVEGDSAVDPEEYDNILGSLLNKLSAKELDIISRRYGILGNKHESLEEIGSRYGVTRERIRQVEKVAMDKMRDSNKVREVKAYD